jgi:hypothetical protein
MHALLLSKDAAVSRAQVEPFHVFREELRRSLDFEFEEWSLSTPSEIDLGGLRRFDAVFVQAKFFVRDIPALLYMLRGIEGKKVLLDDHDCTGRCFLEAVPLIDLYVKNQILRDFEDYRYTYTDRRIHAHFVERVDGPVPAPRRKHVSPAFRDKLCVGWNLGTARWLHQELADCDVHASRAGADRPIDVSMRVSLGRRTSHWYHSHRQRALEALGALGDSMRVVSSSERVGLVEYQQELRDSKMSLSPWGLGEVCFRDFEAVIAGALLIKPPMDHLTTHPDIFVPGETFVPVRPDFSDLRPICEHFLKNEEERVRITRAALERYRAYFQEKTFVAQLGKILARLRA